MSTPIKRIETQFAMSYELLLLIEWLVDFEQEELQKLVARALQNGLSHHIKNEVTVQEKRRASAELQESIIDLFSVLEAMIYNSINEDEAQQVMQNHWLPSLKYIDTKECDAAIVNMSANKASSAHKKGINAKEVLCKELLKRWKPSKNSLAH